MFIVGAVVACLVMYGAGFGIGKAINSGSGGSGNTTSTSSGGSKTSDETAIVSKLEDALGIVADARSTFVQKAPSGILTGNPCTPATDIKQATNDAVDARTQAVHDIVDKLVKDHPSAKSLAKSFDAMVDANNHADQLRIKWIDSTYDAWQQQGCPSSAPLETTNADFENYSKAADDATTAETDFVDTFNPMAKKAGLRSDWSSKDL